MKFKLLVLLMLFVLALPDTASAKKKKPMKKAQPVFTTDWNNMDSLRYHFNLFINKGDPMRALMLIDTIISKQSRPDSIVHYAKISAAMLNQLGASAEAIAMLDSLENRFTKDSLYKGDWFGYSHMQLSLLFASVGGYEKAYFHEQFIMERYELSEQRCFKKYYELFALQNQFETEVKNSKQKSQEIKYYMYSIAAITVLMAAAIVFLMIKNRKLKKRQASQREQMIHTQTQIEKAFDEEERITAEIKKMNEQVARNEAEKNLLKQNVKESTGETLPLLKSQLEAIIRENKEAIPVESYMQLQNTITRFNKQMRDVAGLE